MSVPWRKAAGEKATREGYECTFIKQRGKKGDCDAYLQHGIWAASWPRPVPIKAKTTHLPDREPDAGVPVSPPIPIKPAKQPLQGDVPPANSTETGRPYTGGELSYEEFHRQTGKGRPPEVIRREAEAAKQPLQVKGRTNRKGMLPNGRDANGSPKFENWCGQVYPSDVAYPAWRALTKTATDVANICRAKMGFAKYKLKLKDPVFSFTVAEAERRYKITRPTFSEAIKLLVGVGFLERVVHGGMPDGVGVKAVYRITERWKQWEAPPRDNSNILKARAARKHFAR